MAGKKNPSRFTIQFNARDPQQQAAAEYLERMGRHKAQFLTSAILHYINCPEAPNMLQVSLPSRAELEELILSVLQKQEVPPTVISTATKQPTQPEKLDEVEGSIQTHTDVPLGDEEMAAILRTLSAFQSP